MRISYANKSVGKQKVSHSPKRNKLNSTSHGINTDDKFSTTVQSAKATECWNLEDKKVIPSISSDTVRISYANKSVGKQMVSHSPKRNKLNSTSHGINTDDKFSTTV